MTTDTPVRTEPSRSEPSRVELSIGGMSCGSCATRVQRALSERPGVRATVNLATETATVCGPAGLAPAELIAQVTAAGYTARPPAGEPARAPAPIPSEPVTELGRRLLLVALLALPVVVVSVVPAWQFRHWQWVALALTAPVVLWGAAPFHRAAARLAGRAEVSADTLVSLGTLAALGWSVYSLLLGPAGEPGMRQGFQLTAGPDVSYLDVAAGATLLVLAGRYVEARARRRAGAALRTRPGTGGAVREDGTEVDEPVDRLSAGDRFVVAPGATIAADGEVVEGRSVVRPGPPGAAAEVGPGDPVAAGAENADGRLVVRATRVGAHTRLARTARFVAAAQQGTVDVQRRADRLSAAVVPLVVVIAVAGLGYWLGAGAGPAHAIMAAVAVLLVAGPGALGLGAPIALLAGIGRGAELGILVTGPQVLDAARRVDTVVLDRTGTVTTGQMTLHQVHPADGVTTEQALRLAGAVEQGSAHPIGRAVAAAAGADGAELPDVAEFDSLPGLGVRGVVAELDGDTVIAHAVLVGRPALLAAHDIELPAELVAARAATEAAGHTALGVAWDGVARAVLAVADPVHPASAPALRGLRALGLTPILLTGDDGAAARVLAEQVGIDADSVLAEVQPADKVEVVRRLQGEGRVVALVGTGVDDTAALAAADLGLVLAADADADMAVEAGDLTVRHGDLLGALDAIRLARRTLAVIRSNLHGVLGYHLVAVPLAALGWLNPVLAATAAALCSTVVVTRSLRLRRHTPAADTNRDVGHPDPATPR